MQRIKVLDLFNLTQLKDHLDGQKLIWEILIRNNNLKKNKGESHHLNLLMIQNKLQLP